MSEMPAFDFAETHTPSLEIRLLGRTGLNITEIGFGTCEILGGHSDADDAAQLAALQRSFELGVNFVDTADAYGAGHSEELVGKAIKLSPRRVQVATKVGTVRRGSEPATTDFSSAGVQAACDRSLERLGVTMIDLYQLLNPPRAVIESNEIWDTLRELKNKTKIAHFGISVDAPEDGIQAIEKGEVETVQVAYNMLDRGAANELFALAERKSVGIIVRSPLASGLLAGKFMAGLDPLLARVERLRFLTQGTGRTLAQAALKFCLAHPAVGVVIPGIKTPEQAEENVNAAGVSKLSAEELKRVLEI